MITPLPVPTVCHRNASEEMRYLANKARAEGHDAAKKWAEQNYEYTVGKIRNEARRGSSSITLKDFGDAPPSCGWYPAIKRLVGLLKEQGGFQATVTQQEPDYDGQTDLQCSVYVCWPTDEEIP